MVLILGWIVEAYSNETCTAMLTNGYPPFSDDLRVEIENYAVSRRSAVSRKDLQCWVSANARCVLFGLTSIVCTCEFPANVARQKHGIPVFQDHQW